MSGGRPEALDQAVGGDGRPGPVGERNLSAFLGKNFNDTVTNTMNNTTNNTMNNTMNNSEQPQCNSRGSSNEYTVDFSHLNRLVRRAKTVQTIGRVAHASGTLLKVTGLPVKIGELCRLHNPDTQDWTLEAEVVGLTEQAALLTPLGNLRGICSATQVIATGQTPQVAVGEALLGRVLDARGVPLDGVAQPLANEHRPLHADPPNPLLRRPIAQPLPTGIKSIDSLLTMGEGQRMGIFAVAGGGKSTLLGMLARGAQADVNVIALIGERGREVGEFISDNLNNSLGKSVVVAATSERPALERAQATYTATAIAEYFRDRGNKVLLLVDSVTRYARALRDVGLAAGEPPTRRGFPPSVFSVLPQVMERAGNSDRGSITAFYTVLMEDEDSADPIAEEVRSILDGHIYLSRKLASENHYPAIDVLNSASRLMDKLVSPQHRAQAARARQLLAKYQDIELLLQMGEYQTGNDADADAAVACAAALKAHLTQSTQQLISFADSLESLQHAVNH